MRYYRWDLPAVVTPILALQERKQRFNCLWPQHSSFLGSLERRPCTKQFRLPLDSPLSKSFSTVALTCVTTVRPKPLQYEDACIRKAGERRRETPASSITILGSCNTAQGVSQ